MSDRVSAAIPKFLASKEKIHGNKTESYEDSQRSRFDSDISDPLGGHRIG